MQFGDPPHFLYSERSRKFVGSGGTLDARFSRQIEVLEGDVRDFETRSGGRGTLPTLFQANDVLLVDRVACRDGLVPPKSTDVDANEVRRAERPDAPAVDENGEDNPFRKRDASAQESS